jgi:hypothetical protein
MVLHSFRKKFPLTALLGLGLAATLLISCSSSSGGKADSDSDSLDTDLSFNISGAKAIAASSSSSSSGSMRSASNLADLVKIKEDGTLESAISFSSSYSYCPPVSFISIGSDKSVYICFQSMYSSWNETTQESVNIQFVRVYPDNHFDVLWPLNPTGINNVEGIVSTWTWDGMDYDPLQKGDDGQLYFKVQRYTSGTSSDLIYSYDPASDGKPVLRSPANGNFYFESFKIDSQKHIYIKGSSGSSSNYLRCYAQGVTAPVNIYYSSDSSNWVRGYSPNKSGNAIILNGYNINGMSGIIRANLQGTGSPTYDLLYSSGTNMSYIQLLQYYNSGYSCPTSIIAQDATNSYTWDSSVLTAGTLDKAKLLSRISTLYYTTPTITDENFDLIKSVDNLNEYQTKVTSIKYANGLVGNVSGNSLGSIISGYSEGFLRQYFDGQLMTDWVSSKGLTNFDVGNVADLIWGPDGSLFGIYNPMYYGSADNSACVMKLLDSAGNKTLDIVPFVNGKCKPSKIKIIDGYLYYRYSVMNGTAETGYHRLARFNLSTSTEEELFTGSGLSGRNVELLSYDVSSDNSTMYISALDYATNAIIFGKIDLASKQFTEIPADTMYGTVRTF